MEITGTVAWGNGEPCPFCGEMVPDEQHIKHLFQEHNKQMNEKLFARALMIKAVITVTGEVPIKRATKAILLMEDVITSLGGSVKISHYKPLEASS